MLFRSTPQSASAPTMPSAMTTVAAPQPTDAPAAPTITITSATELATALQSAKEILLYSYYSSNIEIADFADGKMVYYDRKGDADFPKKLAVWLQDKTGRAWTLERCEQSPHKQTVTEQKKEELVSDPLIANAMSLFENAEIVGVSK